MVLYAAFVLAVVCLLAWIGYSMEQNSLMTEEKLAAFSDSTDLSQMSGLDRAKVLRALEEKVNRLSLEERRKWWLSGHWRKWCGQRRELPGWGWHCS